MIFKKLTEICKPKQWKTISQKELDRNGKYVVYGANGPIGNFNNFNHDKETLIIGCRGSCGKDTIRIVPAFTYINGNAMCFENLHKDVNIKYLYYFLKSCDYSTVITGVAQPQITAKSLSNIIIPIPAYNEQAKIVTSLSQIENSIALLKLKEKYLDELIKSRFIEMFGDVCNNTNTIYLEDLCEKITDGSHNPPKGIESSSNLMISSQNIHDNIIDYKDARLLSDRDFAIEDKRTNVRIGDVLLTIVGAIGRSAVVIDDIKVTCQRSVCVIHPKKDAVNPVFLKHMLDCIVCQIETEARGVAQKGIYLNQVKKLQVIKPDIEKQNQFASFVEQIDKSKFVILDIFCVTI